MPHHWYKATTSGPVMNTLNTSVFRITFTSTPPRFAFTIEIPEVGLFKANAGQALTQEQAQGLADGMCAALNLLSAPNP